MLRNEKARHILALNREEKRIFLKSFDIVLSDCDGVLWMTKLIPGTGEAINLLKQSGKSCKFISNNSMRSDDNYLERFRAIGAKDVIAKDVIHPAKTIAAFLQADQKYQKVFTLADRVFDDALRGSGVEVVELKEETSWTAQNLIEKIPPKDAVQAVIIDVDFNLTYAQICRAQQYLLNSGCDLICGANEKLLPLDKSFNAFGPAAIIEGLSTVTGKKPLILGKPGDRLGQFLIEKFNIGDPKRALFVGDSLVQDIQFGISCGFQTLFVLSGVGTKEEMRALQEVLKPDYIADSIVDFLEFFDDL